MQHTTAILVFARTARSEQLHKKLDVHSKLATHTFLYEQTLLTVKASGIPFYLVDESQQIGNNFGERFSNAFQQVFNLGYSNVIAVGTDCPQRTSKDLLLCRDLVEQNKVCLGPDTHGGVHVLGLSKQIFEQGILDDISWNTIKVFGQLTRFLKKRNLQNQSVSLYTDINSSADMLNLLNNRFIEKSLRQILQQLLCHFITQWSFVKSFLLPSTYNQVYLLRGPPVVLPFFL